MNTLVSIVVATYRREEALSKALQSLGKQTYSPIEVVLVDDNAVPDWNAKVCKAVSAFVSENPDVSIQHITNEQNQGSAETRNIGIRAARGEYITFLDDDDVYLPEKVAHQLLHMQEVGSDYSITDLDLYNEQDKLIDKRTRTYITDTTPEALRAYHLKYHLTGTDTMMFRREYLLAIGGFEPIDVGDEFYLMQKAIEGGGAFSYLPICDIRAYVHTGEGGVSSGQGKINGEKALYEYKKQFLPMLSRSDRRYIRMRHHAVLAFAYLRMRKMGGTVKHGICSVLTAPLAFLKLLKDRKV
jgi:glycosyltransferase involved in cell wall biosynthesis